MKFNNKKNEKSSIKKDNNVKKNKKKKVSLKDKMTKFYKKNIKRNNNKFTINEMLSVMIITFLFGIIIGGFIMFGKGTFSSDISDSLNEFADTYQDILSSYYKNIDANELLQSGIEGMIDYLGDPYASYMDASESQEFNEKVEGEYSGIGAEVTYNYKTEVVSIGRVFDNSSAQKEGLMTGDVLLSVDGKEVKGLTISEIASLVKGKKGTKVTLKVKRNDLEMNFTLTRGMVDIESVTSKVLENKNKKIGYIVISIFANNTYKQFKDHFDELQKQNIEGLIIDVRNNSGGYLSTVTDIISLFTEKGSVIYQLKTKDKVEKIKDKTSESCSLPVVILTNSASASASEVLTAALSENYGAKIVGTKTFGKGKVQKAYTLSNGAMIKYTFQEWLTPNGHSIDSVGIEPDVLVEYVYDLEGNDNQLDEALKQFNNK